jgi:hypothetical protein
MSTNALSGLLNILVGSSVAGSTKGTSKAKTERGIKDAKLRKAISSIQKDIRDSIDANLPVFYLVNAEVVVDAMLEEIHPSKGAALTKYLQTLKTTENIFSFSDIEGSTSQVKNAFGAVISSKTTGGFADIYAEKYNRLLASRDSLIKNLILSLKSSTNTTTINRVSQDISKLSNSFNTKLAAISALDLGDMDTKLSLEATKLLRALGTLLRRYFKSAGISRITDPEFLITNYDPRKHVLVIGANYTRTTEVVHATMTAVLERYVKALGITPFSGSTGFKSGNFAAAGHSALKSGESVIGINTPQTLIASMILADSGLDAPGILSGFVLDTGHNDWAIDVTENYAQPSKIFLSLGISFLQSQPSIYNSGILSPQETSYFKKYFKEKLNKDVLALRKKLTDSIKNPTVFSYVFKTFKLSPSLSESIQGHVMEALGGKRFVGPSKSANFITNNTNSATKLSLGMPAKALLKGKALHNKVSKSKPVSRNVLVPVYSLVRLESLINASLVEKIKQNMGDGSRRDVLNLRSGRLAESAKVERLSESRAGMLTVFYSYMKNPYATFSEGGRQQSPRSRDPKLLISKSIREIAETQVSNRLRAVLV